MFSVLFSMLFIKNGCWNSCGEPPLFVTCSVLVRSLFRSCSAGVFLKVPWLTLAPFCILMAHFFLRQCRRCLPIMRWIALLSTASVKCWIDLRPIWFPNFLCRPHSFSHTPRSTTLPNASATQLRLFIYRSYFLESCRGFVVFGSFESYVIFIFILYLCSYLYYIYTIFIV